jgi:hypothetical protein
MYFPSFNVIAKVPGTALSEHTVTLPRVVMEALLRRVFAGKSFDAKWYLATYPDVREAIASKVVDDAVSHFVRFGYYEGRLPAAADVDVAWYESQYQDVAAAIKAKKVSDARQHFMRDGHKEARSPNAAAATEFAEVMKVASQW